MRVDTIQLAPMGNSIELQTLWSEIEYLVDDSELYWKDLYTKEFLRDNILCGNIQLWLLKEAVSQKIKAIILTQIIKYPARLVGEILLAAGEGLIENIRVGYLMEDFAATFNVDYILIKGRIGWKKPLEKLGYTMFQASYSKHIKTEE